MESARIEEWSAGGERESFRGHSIYVRAEEGDGPVLLLLHGFPSSSYDFRLLLPLLGDNAKLTFDFTGFGLSDKPRGYGYSLFKQAGLAEEMVARRFPGREVFLVAHDMGTSVATELMARDIDGTGSLELAGAVLFNGSIVLHRATLTPSQRLLRSRLGPLAARLSNERFFRQQFGSVFSAAHPLTTEEAEDQWELICRGGGRTLGHELVAYLDERLAHAARWHGAIRDWRRSFNLIWGMRDPVATTAVLEAVMDLRPGVPVTELPELGHYPQLEGPEQVATAVREAVGR